MTKLRILAGLLLAAPLFAFAQTTASPASDARLQKRVERVLMKTPLIDGHNDLPGAIGGRFGNVGNIDLNADTTNLQGKLRDGTVGKVSLMTDIPRLRKGQVGAQFWSVFIPASITGPAAVKRTTEQIDIVRTMVAKYPEAMEMAYTAGDIERVHRAGRIASLIGVEGGHQMDNSMAVLRGYYVLGVRYMTLTHARTTDWADAATDAPKYNGLNGFGRAVVHEMNRLGMLVDISHVSPDTMRDALETSLAPVIYSHSSARALVDHPRDVPDDVLRLVKANHGVVMVNFNPPFISQVLFDWSAEHAGATARFATRYSGQPDRAAKALAGWEQEHPEPRSTLAEVADHVEHIRKIAGVESVGIGSDFDGIGSTPDGLDAVDKYPALLVELARRGWSDDDLASLAGRNLLRVMGQAEQVAKRLQAIEAPSHATLELDGKAAAEQG